MKPELKAIALIVPALALLAGCGARNETNPHAVDSIYLDEKQERDIFVSSNNLGPETSVVVLANVPKAKYENGAIVLTGGKQLMIVQPHAWRTYTGTAISTEEAERIINRAERLDQTIRDLSDATSDLRSYLDDRATGARKEIEWQREEEAHRRADLERRRQERAATVGRVQRQYETEIMELESARDRLLAQNDREREAEIEEIAAKHSQRVLESSESSSLREQQINKEYAQGVSSLTESYQLTREAARAKGQNSEYFDRLKQMNESEVAKLDKRKQEQLANLTEERRIAVAKAREESTLRFSDIRSRYAVKAERIKQAHDEKVARLVAEKEDTSRRATDAEKPVEAPAPKPTPAPTPAVPAQPAAEQPPVTK